MTIIEADEHPTQAPSFELEQIDMYGKYMLSSRLEILFVLRALQKSQCRATIYFDHGRSFFLTALLAVDDGDGCLTLDLGSDDAINRAAARASHLVFTATLDRVKIQFLLAGLETVDFLGRPAFRAALPTSLLRLQRREYFRLDIPAAHRLHCQVPAQRADGATHTLDLPLLDFSGGGIGLMAGADAAPYFEIGAIFPNCKFEVPQEGVVAATLSVRGAFPVTPRSGHPFVRVGCEFHNLPGTRLTMIQRYITRIERERKARLSGLE